MTILSKFFAGTLGFRLLTANCHEFCHTWNPHCYYALTDALGDALRFCLKTYGTLYLVNAAVRSGGNFRKVHWRNIIKNTIRSSLFLTMNLIMLVFFICKIRQLLGFAIWPTVSFTSSFISSLIAIFIEAKKRRMMLAMYLTNLASESVFRQLLHRGKVRKVNGAETLLFSCGLAIIFYLLSENVSKEEITNASSNKASTNKKTDEDYMRGVLRFTHCDSSMTDELKKASALRILRNIRKILPQELQRLVFSSDDNRLSNNAAKSICSVQHSARNFGIGLCVNLLMTFLKNIRRPKNFIKSAKNPSALLRMPAFFALMPLVYQLVECFLQRWAPNVSSTFAHSICGGLSGLAMFVWPNTNISMYVLWKAIEMMYTKLSNTTSFLPNWKHGDALLYGLASGYVVGVAVIEPHALRSNYYKFLSDLTGKRIELFNRELIGRAFGFDSNQLYNHFVPGVNQRHATINPQFYMPSQSLKPFGTSA